MNLIDKDALVAEIERLVSNGKLKCQQSQENNDRVSYIAWSEHIATLGKIISFLDTLEVKEVDLEKEIDEVIHNYKLNNHRHTSICSADIEWIAEHFFEFGVKASQNNVMGILEREVKIDAGGYPCIDCYIEFYDYDKDIPLAKEGDKVKVILVKGE